jgi:apolipoprotein N-acyltransferase
VGEAVLLGLLAGLALPVLAWVPASFLSGGLLLTYVEALRPGMHNQQPRPFHWRRFAWGCWHWWGTFLLWGAIQALAFLGVMVPAIVLGAGAVAAAGRWLAWIVAPLLGLLAILGLMLVEWTRILAVVDGTRNLFRAFGQAGRFVFRHPLAVSGLYGLSLLLVGAVHAVYRLGLMPLLPLDWWLLVLLVQQTFILARLGTRLARLAGGVALSVQSRQAAVGQTAAAGADP